MTRPHSCCSLADAARCDDCIGSPSCVAMQSRKTAEPAALSALRALDRLQPPQTDPEFSAELVLVPVFILTMSCVAVRSTCFILETLVFPWAPAALRVASELCSSIFLIDLISGILHASLDYANTGDRLRELIPTSKEAVHRVRRSHPAFHRSSAWAQVIWNFQAHHFAPYPEHDNQWLETACLATPLLIWTLLQHAAGFLAPLATRLWLCTLVLGHGVQASHFLSHRRVHLGDKALPKLVLMLQDAGVLLHPRVHRVHHETFDRNFCIFNGVANPLVNAGFRVARRMGCVDAKVTLGGGQSAAATGRGCNLKGLAE